MGDQIFQFLTPAASASSASAASAASEGGSFFTKGNALSAVQGGASLASLLAKRRATDLKVQQYRDAGNESLEDISALRSETLNRANTLKQNLLQTLGERDVAYAAGGVDLGFGTPTIARNEAAAATDRALTLDQQEEQFKADRLRTRANRYFQAAKNARSAGNLEILAGGLETSVKLFERGLSQTPKTKKEIA